MEYKDTRKITKYKAKSTKKRKNESSDFHTSYFLPEARLARGGILQRGVAIYLALIILSVILAIGIGMSAILIGQMKITKGMENSVVALYAADSGIERILYEEKICRQSGCDPAHCKSYPASGICFGLKEDYNATSTDLMDGKASYDAWLEYFDDDGEKKIRFTSIGEYEGVKRAIESVILLPPPLKFAVWRGACENTVPVIVYNTSEINSYSFGYQFTPEIDGKITELCGYFNSDLGTGEEYWVRVYDDDLPVRNVIPDTGDGLAQVGISHNADNDTYSWECKAITPAEVTASTTYFVVVEMDDLPRGYFMRNNFSSPLPGCNPPVHIDTGFIQIGTPFTEPQFLQPNFMFGMVDITFVLD